MCTTTIMLHSIKELHSFVDTVSDIPVDVMVKAGDYTLNPKSLLSMLSLDLSKPFSLVIPSPDDVVPNEIQPFILQR